LKYKNDTLKTRPRGRISSRYRRNVPRMYPTEIASFRCHIQSEASCHWGTWGTCLPPHRRCGDSG